MIPSLCDEDTRDTVAPRPAFAAQIKTIAGTGKPGAADDGAKAIESPLNNPYGLTIGPDGGLYVCEVDNHRVVRIDRKSGRITVVAGNGSQGLLRRWRTRARRLAQPAVRDPVRQSRQHVLRRDAEPRGAARGCPDQDHHHRGGHRQAGFSGDGGPANKAELSQPHSIALDPQGRLLICDIANRRIRRVDLKSGIIETYAGTGERKNPADGAPLEGAPLNGPRAIAVDAEGHLLVVLREGNAVYRIDAAAEDDPPRRRHRREGQYGRRRSGQTGEVERAEGHLGRARRHFYIADTENHTIRRIDPKSGIITTVAGTGERGDGPDGNPLACKLYRPHGIFVGRTARSISATANRIAFGS